MSHREQYDAAYDALRLCRELLGLLRDEVLDEDQDQPVLERGLEGFEADIDEICSRSSDAWVNSDEEDERRA